MPEAEARVSARRETDRQTDQKENEWQRSSLSEALATTNAEKHAKDAQWPLEYALCAQLTSL